MAIVGGDTVGSLLSKDGQPSWYAVRVKSHCEFVTATALRLKGYEEFLPSYRSRRSWSDRVKEIDVPMFPGYIFCRFDAANFYHVLNTRGVVDVASAGSKLLPLEEAEVNSIQTICRAGLRTVPWPFVPGGRRVRIDHGPLAGAKGIVLRQSDACRIVVSVSILQRSVSAEIEPAWI